MSDFDRPIWQLLGNIGGVAFVIIVGFSQLADYLTDRKARHLFAALAWFVLVPVLVLRTAAIPDPPLIDPVIIADWVSVGWVLTLALGLTWGLLRLFEKRREAAARRKLGIEPEPERKVEP